MLSSKVKQILAAAFALGGLAMAQHSDVATIERHGGFSTLSVHTFRPLDAIATTLEARFGFAVGAEDPTVRAGTMVPARWGFQVRFAVKPEGSPQDVRGLLDAIVAAANEKSPFGYRVDSSANAYSFVPTRTRDSEGRSTAGAPLLDRAVTIPPGVRWLNESAMLMAKELSRQTGLRVNCC